MMKEPKILADISMDMPRLIYPDGGGQVIDLAKLIVEPDKYRQWFTEWVAKWDLVIRHDK